MTLSLPEREQEKIRGHIKSLSDGNRCLIQKLAVFIATLVFICPAIKYGYMHMKLFERAKLLHFISTNCNYRSRISIDLFLHFKKLRKYSSNIHVLLF